MFTGIIEELGTVAAAGKQLVVEASKVATDSEQGSSLAVNGVCLTVVERSPNRTEDRFNLGFDLSAETLSRTSLGELQPGDRVNLERPVTLMTRLGGHLVQGHVDGRGKVLEVRDASPGRVIRFEVSKDLSRFIVEKGSVAIDGVSLTAVNAEDGCFDVALIPHTLEATTLGLLEPGASVNVELDVLAKYVERLLKERG